ncbi:hypothetical protein KM043_009028 [Ampulex compressa]|nr:hypothetical protein KM043_009028 [Ampulex compressa]
MAGIFNLFGEISGLDKGQAVKPLVTSKTSIEVGVNNAKAIGQKPKGLSLRPSSEINIQARSSSFKQNALSVKQQDLLKPKLTQVDGNGCPISPTKDISNKMNQRPNKIKSLGMKKETSTNKVVKQQVFGEHIFKEPLPPKTSNKNIYPEPETLAPYCNLQFDFDDEYSMTLQRECKKMLSGTKHDWKPYDDEGFESDPEPLDLLEIPKIIESPVHFEDNIDQLSPALPEISDTEDFL